MNGGPLSISHALGRGHVTLKKDLCLPDAGLLCALRSLLCSCLTILQGYVQWRSVTLFVGGGGCKITIYRQKPS